MKTDPLAGSGMDSICSDTGIIKETNFVSTITSKLAVDEG